MATPQWLTELDALKNDDDLQTAVFELLVAESEAEGQLGRRGSPNLRNAIERKGIGFNSMREPLRTRLTVTPRPRPS